MEEFAKLASATASTDSAAFSAKYRQILAKTKGPLLNQADIIVTIYLHDLFLT